VKLLVEKTVIGLSFAL